MHSSIPTGRAMHAAQGPQATRVELKQTELGAAIRAANSMTLRMQERAPLLGDHEFELRVFVDLFVLNQFEEAIVGNILASLIAAAIKQHGQGKETKGDGDQDNAAPVKTGFGAARFVLAGGVAIGLWHKKRALSADER